ncbi:MAG TPA: Gfo/Idh/MocA family oxidoreductase [Myxococcota bacterium]|nr:Gfo/Idh/MocA family oxidoreductase [Myxococcota bacterium]
MSALRIAVIGAGVMGGHHARKVHDRARREGDVALVGISDSVLDRARAIGGELGAPAVADPAELFAKADAAIVAVSAVAHYEVARRAIEAGLDVLVEKPIAATLDEAEALVALAARRARVLQVGHQEWFNAAMRVVREQIDQPRFAEIHRLGPFPERGADVDVVRDLMIHDIEILQQLLGAEPERVDAVGVEVITDHVDIANARLAFPGACIANLTASRVSATPMRKFRLFQRDAYFSIDFLAQKAMLFRRVPAAEGGKKIEMQALETDPEDALAVQLDVFVSGVRRRSAEGSSGVTGAQAASALRTALRVIDAMPETDHLR